jgi:hypothetical protein
MTARFNMSSLLIDHILRTHKITDYLRSKGINPDGPERNGKLFYKCPIHTGDNTPSFVVYTQSGEFENFWCYGCLDADEVIWTPRGLVRIGNIQIGDDVLDVAGNVQKVICTQNKSGNCLGVSLGSFRHPLVLTHDHTCLVIKQDNALGAFRRLFFNSHHGRLTFRKDLSLRPRHCEPQIIQTRADALSVGDYFVFPVIQESQRENTTLSSSMVLKPYLKGRKLYRINELPATIDAAWFYGLYVAEGSSSGRVVQITLNLNEDHLANRAVAIVQSVFGVPGKIKKRLDNHTINLTFCSADLAAHLRSTFGKGACYKKIDGSILKWQPLLQRSFLDGYRSGDGSKRNGTIVTCSYNLAIGVFGLAVQCGYCPSFHIPTKGRVDDDGTRHNEWYAVGFRRQDGVNGFHEVLNGTEYYVMPITSIVEAGNRPVIDISVTGTETFLTKLGATHNCKAHYHIIHLFRDLEKVSLKQAIKALSNGMKIDDEAEYLHAQKLIENDTSVQAQFTPDTLALQISRQLFDFLQITNHDPDCLIVADKVGVVVDQAVAEGDLDGLHRLYEMLPDMTRKKVALYLEKQERGLLENNNGN